MPFNYDEMRINERRLTLHSSPREHDRRRKALATYPQYILLLNFNLRLFIIAKNSFFQPGIIATIISLLRPTLPPIVYFRLTKAFPRFVFE